MRVARALGVAALLFTTLACGDEVAGEADADPPIPDASGLDGARLYAEMCAACHGETGQGGLGPVLRDWPRGETELRTIIETRMPEGRPEDCGPACAVAVSRFILDHLTTGALACAETVPPSERRLRLLTRREYRNTIFDLFPMLEPSSDGAPSDTDCRTQRFEYDPAGRTHSTVHLAGTFNGWSPDAWPLAFDATSGRWWIERALENGTHEYKLVLDGTEWITDPAATAGVPDGFGGTNSVRVVSCDAAVDAPATGSALGDPAASFPPETRPEGFPFDTEADGAVVTAVHADEHLRAAKRIAIALGDRVADLYECEPGDACADAFLRTFGPRVFRRPLTDAEIERYRALLLSEDSFDEGIRLAVRTLLVSPHFLYRSELGEPAGDGTHRLTPWEVATALSYTFWGTTPDDALLDLAARGELSDAATIEREARRLLDDPRSRDTVRIFGLQWLGVERIADAPKSETLYPGFDEATRAAMLEESARLVEHVVFDSTGQLDELFTADYGFADGERVAYADDRRAGVLGQPSVLASYAHSDQSSPIQRGLWVRRNLLCQSFPRPPANAGGVPDVDPGATTLERFRQHTDDPACSSCHRYIDPVGFGFERFDAIGAWRDTENGLPIDAHGNMNDVEGLGTGTDAPFESLAELGAILAASDSADACFVRQWLRFSRGHRETLADRCALERLTERFRETGGDVRALMIDTVSSPDFITRRDPETP